MRMIKLVSKKNIVLFSLLLVIIIVGAIIIPIVIFNLQKNTKMPEGGPYYHQIYCATSTDGINWTVNHTLLFNHASVPGAVYFNGSIYVYFVDGICGSLKVAISHNNGSTYSIYAVSINGTNSPMPVDPAPIVDGSKIRLTYLGNLNPSGINHKIVTAVSDNGINFNEEAVIFTKDRITDPDLFQNSTGGWVLFVNTGNQLIKATSNSATGNFTEDTSFSFSQGWLASTVVISGKYYTYLHNGKNISVAEYNSSGLTFIAQNLISGFTGIVADPTVAILGTNKYIMYFKTCTIC